MLLISGSKLLRLLIGNFSFPNEVSSLCVYLIKEFIYNNFARVFAIFILYVLRTSLIIKSDATIEFRVVSTKITYFLNSCNIAEFSFKFWFKNFGHTSISWISGSKIGFNFWLWLKLLCAHTLKLPIQIMIYALGFICS